MKYNNNNKIKYNGKKKNWVEQSDQIIINLEHESK